MQYVSMTVVKFHSHGNGRVIPFLVQDQTFHSFKHVRIANNQKPIISKKITFILTNIHSFKSLKCRNFTEHHTLNLEHLHLLKQLTHTKKT